MKTKIFFIIFWLVVIVSFLLSIGFILMKANGWNFNFKTGKISQTGMISLSGDIANPQIKLNGKLYGNNLPLKITNLAQGYYDVTIEKENYQGWQKTVPVEEGKAALFRNILLFFKEPQEAAVPSNITQEVLDKEYQNQSAKIKIAGSEIFYNNIMVSRFSQNIAGAIIYPDEAHLIFQTGDEIDIIELDGGNNQPLVKLSSNLPTRFFLRDNGRTLYYLDGEKIFGRTIR